jgi:hypothetical protein
VRAEGPRITHEVRISSVPTGNLRAAIRRMRVSRASTKNAARAGREAGNGRTSRGLGLAAPVPGAQKPLLWLCSSEGRPQIVATV